MGRYTGRYEQALSSIFPSDVKEWNQQHWTISNLANTCDTLTDTLIVANKRMAERFSSVATNLEEGNNWILGSPASSSSTIDEISRNSVLLEAKLEMLIHMIRIIMGPEARETFIQKSHNR